MCMILFMDTRQTVAVQLIILIMHISGTVVTMADSLDRICVRSYPPYEVLVCFWRDSLQWARASSFTRFLDHTKRRTIVGRTSLEEWSASRRDLYLTTHNTHNRQTSMSSVGFEPTISAAKRSQTYTLGCAATGIGSVRRIKAVLLHAWSGPEVSRKLRFSYFMTTAQDGGKVVSLTHRSPLLQGNTPGTHFC
jgi:hypothetical protein